MRPFDEPLCLAPLVRSIGLSRRILVAAEYPDEQPCFMLVILRIIYPDFKRI